MKGLIGRSGAWAHAGGFLFITLGVWMAGLGSAVAQSVPWELECTWWRAADSVDGGPGVPVGEWALEDAAWREEIPWLDGVVAQPGGAAGAQWVVPVWETVPVDAGDLTDRQRAILLAQQGSWEGLAESFFVAGGRERGAYFHWAVPALRWNAEGGCFERLLGAAGWVDFAAGAGGGGERWVSWPESSPLAGEGVYRMSVPRSGVYKLDAGFWAAAGVDYGELDPRRVVIYGNGGLPLPMSNAVERPLGVRTVAALRRRFGWRTMRCFFMRRVRMRRVGMLEPGRTGMPGILGVIPHITTFKYWGQRGWRRVGCRRRMQWAREPEWK